MAAHPIRRPVITSLALALLAVSAQAQWTVDYSVRYEAAGQALGQPGERRGPDTLVSQKTSWWVQQEVRGTLAYTQPVRGAVASNMPDRNNEQRYESWLHRPRSAGTPAWLKIDGEEVVDRAARLGQADGEGAGELNRERAGRFGRVEHQRTRLALAAEGETAARLAGAFLQIDRVDGKLHFEPPVVDFDPAQMRYAVDRVVRMDLPAAAGEWDARDPKDGAQRTRALRLPQLPVQVFDLPPGAEVFEGSRTVDVPGRIGGTATLRILLRRTGTTAAAAPGIAPAATGAPVAMAVKTRPDCPPPSDGAVAGANAGAEVGGKVLGGGHGRQVGAAVGSFLGALGGAHKGPVPAGTASADCPR